MSGILIFILCILMRVPAQNNARSTQAEIEDLIQELYKKPWDDAGAWRFCLGANYSWSILLDEPMKKIIEKGPSTQDVLIKKLSDPLIMDKVMILLGGVGNESAIGPIIDAMVEEQDIKNTSKASAINLAANVALTNITVADVVYPYESGCFDSDKCRDNSKGCWQRWWKANQIRFNIKRITQNRNYGNYPNYGIYKQP
jgi:hypothetical protein